MFQLEFTHQETVAEHLEKKYKISYLVQDHSLGVTATKNRNLYNRKSSKMMLKQFGIKQPTRNWLMMLDNSCHLPLLNYFCKNKINKNLMKNCGKTGGCASCYMGSFNRKKSLFIILHLSFMTLLLSVHHFIWKWIFRSVIFPCILPQFYFSLLLHSTVVSCTT